MRKIIIPIILMLLLAGFTKAEQYFVLDVNYIIGSVTFNSINLKEVDRTIKYTDTSGFLVKIVSFEDSDIEKIYFNMTENKKYLLYVPYNENAAKIEVYNLKNSKVMDIDVSSFADTCGNNKCEEHESYESCTKDCPSGNQDDFCDELKDGICDPDCSAKTDIDCEGAAANRNVSFVTKTKTEDKEASGKTESGKKPNYILWVLVVLAVVILVAVFLFIKNRKKNQIITSLKQYISENIRKGFTLQQIKDALSREGYSEREIDRAVRSI